MIVRLAKLSLLIVLILLVYIPGLPLIPHPIKKVAADSSFTLFGKAIGGWGFTSATIRNPGPDLVVVAGTTVTLTLNSVDSAGIPHQFCVDFDVPPDFELTGCDTPREVSTRSAFFTSTSPVTYSFTADSTPGNYTYFCTVHTGAMQGKFVILPAHDVAVTALAVSRNFAYEGVTANPVQVNVTATNFGASAETFYVSAKANSTLIGNTTTPITVQAGLTKVVTFNWTTLGLARGKYLITGQATKVSGETNTANNNFPTNGSFIFTVKFRGDVTGDCQVDVIDLTSVGSTLFKSRGDPAYNPPADLNNDGAINVIDLSIVGGNIFRGC